MEPRFPQYLPDPHAAREEMEALQRRVADAATFDDAFSFDPERVGVGLGVDADEAAQTRLDGTRGDDASDDPVVAGIDQAFLDESAVSAVVCLQGGEVIERVHARSELSIPYVPGLLSFREGGPIGDALAELDADPDLLLFDGSGRIHFRQAGLATHMGVVFDRPSVGVAKSLLCGRPRESVDGRPEGWRTPVLADGDVDAPDGRVIGYAYQSRQYASSRRINPLYISPGHRVSAGTAVALVARCCAGYKLPEPVRLADAHADATKAEYTG
jgi:deoxyribonuclease V